MLYITRHGQTDWNKEERLQGHTDIPLNENGKEMAKAAGIRYSDIKFDVCYSSPLLRAKETAELILEGSDIQIITADRLKEMCFGEYEGVRGYFKDPNFPLSNLFRHPEEYVPIGGSESFESLKERTSSFIEEVLIPDMNAGKTILVVAHGDLNCGLISQLRKTPLKDFWNNLQQNCELEAFTNITSSQEP